MVSQTHSSSPLGKRDSFWTDKRSWKQAAKNTLNCLIGCSIGDLGTIVVFQSFWPEVNIFLVMLSVDRWGSFTK